MSEAIPLYNKSNDVLLKIEAQAREAMFCEFDAFDPGNQITSVLVKNLPGLLENMLLTESKEEHSLTDDLTKLPNRRAFKARMIVEVEKANRNQTNLAIAVVDLDDFKLINDVNGHLVGDLALIVLARLLESKLRIYDFVARWGGDEFAIIMPNVSLGKAKEVLERVRKEIAEEDIVFNDTCADINIHSSVGLSGFYGDNRKWSEEERDVVVDKLFNDADGALYLAKSKKNKEDFMGVVVK
jgi:diguanylate cyclase